MNKVILARHAESEFSARGAVNGDPGVRCPLTPRGRDQARRLGESLVADRIGLCVVTAFERTKETADVALNGRSVPRLILPELNDPPLGELEGGQLSDLRSWLRRNGPMQTVPGGGESRVETLRRFRRGFRILLERREDVLLVVAHGLGVTLAVRAARGLDLPLTLEDAQVAPATAHPLRSEDLERVVRRLGEWLERPAHAEVRGSVP